jgi:hypothetical protein
VTSTVDIGSAITSRDKRRGIAAGLNRLQQGADRRAPKVTGHLIESGRTDVLTDTLGVLRYDADYAHYHETAGYLKHTTGGQAHFLERTVKLDMNDVIDAIASELFRD